MRACRSQVRTSPLRQGGGFVPKHTVCTHLQEFIKKRGNSSCIQAMSPRDTKKGAAQQLSFFFSLFPWGLKQTSATTIRDKR